MSGKEEMIERLRARVEETNTISVFLSSPFSGMEHEREEIVKKYMPQLRGMCEPRGIFIKLVDLRWGITDEQAAQNLTLKICLQEIDRCDIFVGMYGRRYGTVDSNEPNKHWVAQAFDIAQDQYPFVNDWRDRAITELEFRHGCLNEADSRPAFFYFRDFSYDEKMAREHANNSVLRDKYTNPSKEHEQKLANLEAEVQEAAKSAKMVSTQAYNEPADAALAMFEDLRELVQKLLPDKLSAKLDEETETHWAFASCRRRLYVGGEHLVRNIETHVKNSSNPLVIEGESGSGKSSLLANWIAHHMENNPTDRIFYHFTGCDSASTRLRNLLVRLVRFGTSDKEGTEATSTDALVSLLPGLLAEIASNLPGQSRLFVVLDALNQLENETFGWLSGRHVHRLGWLPMAFPSRVVLICSSLPGECLDSLRARPEDSYTFQSTVPLTIDDRRQFSQTMMKNASKTLTEVQLKTLLKNPATSNPLFLTLLLEELIAFGVFEKLLDKMNELSSCDNIPQLLTAVLSRIEETFKDAPVENIVDLVFQSIGASARGIMEHEIQAVLEKAGGCNPLLWSQLFFAIKHLLVEKSGRLTFLHDYIRQAVDIRYLKTEESRQGAHNALANYFVAQPLRFEDGEVNSRKVDVELEHLRLAGRGFDAVTTLCDILHLEAKCESGLLYEIIEDFRETHRLFRNAKDGKISESMWQDFDDYRHMVTLQVHYLSKLPKQLLQVAANEPDITAPAESSVNVLTKRKQPWLQLVNKDAERSPSIVHFDGHKGPVYSVSSSSDGSMIVSGSRQAQVRVWSMQTGEVLYIFHGHTSAVMDTAFYDNETVISCSNDETIRVWDLKLGGERACLTPNTGKVNSLSCSPKTERFLTAHHEAVIVWRYVTLSVEHTVKFPDINIQCLSFSPDSSTFIIDSDNLNISDQEIMEFSFHIDGEAPQKVSSLPTGSDPSSGSGGRELSSRQRSICFSPEGDRICVVHPSTQDVTIYQRTNQAWKSTITLTGGHSGKVFSCAWSPDGTRVLTGAQDKLVIVWDATPERSGTRILNKLVGHAWTVFCVDFLQGDEGNLAVSAAGVWDKRVLVWDLDIAAHNKKDQSPPHFRQIVMGGCYSPDFSTFLSSGQNGPATVIAWDPNTMTETESPVRSFGRGRGYSPAITPFNEYALNGQTGALTVTSMNTWEIESKVLPNVGCTGDVIVSPCGRYVVTSGAGSTAQQEGCTVHDIDSGEVVERLSCPNAIIMAMSPSGKRMVLAGSSAHVWQISPPKELGTLSHRTARSKIYGVAYSPCGRFIGTASPDNTVFVWGAQSLELVSRCSMWDRAYRLVFTPDSQYICCGGDDKTVGLWGTKTGEEAGRIYVGAGVGTVSTGAGGVSIMAGDDIGRVLSISMQNFPNQEPFVTPAHIWNSIERKWTDQPQLKCPFTGKFFNCPHGVISALEKYKLKDHTDCPGASLPDTSFLDADLIVTSPYVSAAPNKMRVTPFAVNTKETIGSVSSQNPQQAKAMKLAKEMMLVRDESIFCVVGKDGDYEWKTQGSLVLCKSFQDLKNGSDAAKLEPGLQVVARHPSYRPVYNATIGDPADTPGWFQMNFADGDTCMQCADGLWPLKRPTAANVGDGVFYSNNNQDENGKGPYHSGNIVAFLPPTTGQEDAGDTNDQKKAETAVPVPAVVAVASGPAVVTQSTCCVLM